MEGPISVTDQTQKNRVYLISDFINLNKKLKLKPYPMLEKNEMWFKLERFKYDTSLDLNIGYYYM